MSSPACLEQGAHGLGRIAQDFQGGRVQEAGNGGECLPHVLCGQDHGSRLGRGTRGLVGVVVGGGGGEAAAGGGDEGGEAAEAWGGGRREGGRRRGRKGMKQGMGTGGTVGQYYASVSCTTCTERCHGVRKET